MSHLFTVCFGMWRFMPQMEVHTSSLREPPPWRDNCTSPILALLICRSTTKFGDEFLPVGPSLIIMASEDCTTWSIPFIWSPEHKHCIDIQRTNLPNLPLFFVPSILLRHIYSLFLLQLPYIELCIKNMGLLNFNYSLAGPIRVISYSFGSYSVCN
jgi:hypothetical protein